MAELKPGRSSSGTGFRRAFRCPRDAMDGAQSRSYEAGPVHRARRRRLLLTRKGRTGTRCTTSPTSTRSGKQKRDRSRTYRVLLRRRRGRRKEETTGVLRGARALAGRRGWGRLHRIALRGLESHENDQRRTSSDCRRTSRSRNARQGSISADGGNASRGLSPFVSSGQAARREAHRNGKRPARAYTLLHANRTQGARSQQKLLEVANHSFDLVYVPSVSRPPHANRRPDRSAPAGPNNLLRHLFDSSRSRGPGRDWLLRCRDGGPSSC